jgi:uncharacterized RDD family membrane protein YckC
VQYASPSSAVLDTAHEVPTPEGIDIALRPAGPIARASAWLIDLLVRLGVLLLIQIVAALLGKFGIAIMLLSLFFLEWLFPAWCEVHWGGATPGKKALGLVVVHDDGTPVRWPAALTRNLLRVVDFLPMFYLFGFAAMSANRDFKRLGDFAAGTLVVYRPAPGGAHNVPQATAIAPTLPLSLAEQRAVLDFAERSSTLTPERAAELAEIARPLTGSARGTAAAAHLIGVANHLIGRQ